MTEPEEPGMPAPGFPPCPGCGARARLVGPLARIRHVSLPSGDPCPVEQAEARMSRRMGNGHETPGGGD
jgi:hypothetical protein